MSDSYDDYEAKIQLAEHAWEKRVVKTEHDRAVELGKAYERGWNAALAQQEPVAWMHNLIEGNVITHIPADIGRHPERWTPLYTAPPKKQWVGLTEEEIQDLSYLSQKIDEGNAAWFDRCGFARAVEQTLKKKNHG